MSGSSLIIVLSLMMSLISLPASATQISVEVEPRKANGKTWDGGLGAFRNPDIAICLSDGKTTTCYPDGSHAKGVLNPKCSNVFSCIFDVSMTSGKMYTITVIDVDAADNDIIGSGTIKKGNGARTVGQSVVIVADSDEASASVLAPPARRNLDNACATRRALRVVEGGEDGGRADHEIRAEYPFAIGVAEQSRLTAGTPAEGLLPGLQGGEEDEPVEFSGYGPRKLGERCKSDCDCKSKECKAFKCVKRNYVDHPILSKGKKCRFDGDCRSCACTWGKCE